jgi:AP-1 complex subunit mu
MEDYFKDVEEESIRDNFVIIYELLDELVDFGYPQTTDGKILQEYITQDSYKLEGLVPKPPPGNIRRYLKVKLVKKINYSI